jgi:hypothetical protein
MFNQTTKIDQVLGVEGENCKFMSQLDRRLYSWNQISRWEEVRSIPIKLVDIIDVRLFQTERITQDTTLIFPHEIGSVENKRTCYRIIRRINAIAGESHRKHLIDRRADIEQGFITKGVILLSGRGKDLSVI